MKSASNFNQDKKSLCYFYCITMLGRKKSNYPKDSSEKHVKQLIDIAERKFRLEYNQKDESDNDLLKLVRSCAELTKHMHEDQDPRTRKTDLLLNVLNNIKD